MNAFYSIMESRHRWLILAALAGGIAIVGSIWMLAFEWPHILPRLWLYLGLLAVVYCLVKAVLQWRAEVETDLQKQSQTREVRSAADVDALQRDGEHTQLPRPGGVVDQPETP